MKATCKILISSIICPLMIRIDQRIRIARSFLIVNDNTRRHAYIYTKEISNSPAADHLTSYYQVTRLGSCLDPKFFSISTL